MSKTAQSQKSPSLLAHEERKASQGYVDFKKLTQIQLIELLERQEHLLKNKSFISKLPDKGEKISAFKTEIETELKKRQEPVDSACDLLSGLSLNTKPEDLEWNKGNSNGSENKRLDSDDDSDENVDALELIATHSGTSHLKKKKIIPPEPSLITEEDLKEIKEAGYAEHMCEKYDKCEEKERFKLNKQKPGSSHSDVKASAEKVKKRLGDKWEVTEATPPIPVHKSAKGISLAESLHIQKEQAERLKEIERQQAAEKLMRSLGVKIGDELPTKNVTEYRIVKDKFVDTLPSDEDEEEERVKDALLIDEDELGT